MTAARSIGLGAGAALIVADTIGQGVFLKGRAMACETANAHVELLAWALAGALTLGGALAFAELATMVPRSGGAYVFLRRAFGGRVAFVFGWLQAVLAGPAAIGALASGAAIFFDRISNGALSRVPFGDHAFAIATIAALAALNCASTRTNGSVAMTTACLKVASLAAIVGGGAYLAFRGVAPSAISPATLAAVPCADVGAAVRDGFAGFAAAMLAALYAYQGWAAVSTIAGEMDRPSITIPRATLGAVALVATLYLLANATFVRSLGFTTIQRLSPHAAVGVVAAEAVFGAAAGPVLTIVLFASVIATLHVVILVFSRVTHAVAEDGLRIRALSIVSARGVPTGAVLATSGIAALYALALGFERLSDYTTFVSWLVDAVVVAGLFRLRIREPNAERPYRVFGYPAVPAAFVAVAACVLISAVASNPVDALAGMLVGAAALPVYAFARRRSAATGTP